MESNIPTRILIVRFSSIGDIVLTTPVIRALKKQLDGEVTMHYLTKSKYADLLRLNPFVDKVITIDNSVSEVEDELRETLYDYVIDLHNNIRSRQAKRATRSLSFTVDKRNLAKWIYVNFKKEWKPIGHIVERYMNTVAMLGIKDDGEGLDFYIDQSSSLSIHDLPDWFRSGFVAYVIGGLQPGKILPVEKAIEMISMIKKPIALLGGPEDKQRGEIIAKAAGAIVWNTCGQYNIQQSASLIQLSDVVITHDTGLMHIASALKKKVISLWFATTPQIGFAPWRPSEASVMIEADCKSRPTSKLGNRRFDDCIFNIDINRIAKEVNG